MEMTFPLHLQISIPETVLTLKSSPERENTFSFICRVCSLGLANLAKGPRGGLNGARGDIVVVGRQPEDMFMYGVEEGRYVY